MKIVTKKITAQRESKVLAGASDSGTAVAFGDRGLFSILRVVIVRESAEVEQTFEIASKYLPVNKTNTTRFRIVETDGKLQIRWCRKVADNMHEITK